MRVDRGCTPGEAATAARIADELEAGIAAAHGRRTASVAGVPPAVSDWTWIAPFYVSVSSQYGAPMGRGVDTPEEFDLSAPLHVQEVPFGDDAYDPGGAYWGGGEMHCVWDDSGHAYYSRDSLREIEARFPGATWVRHTAITCPSCGSESVHTHDRGTGDFECIEFVDETGAIDPEARFGQCYQRFNVLRSRSPKIARRRRHRRLAG